jgi:hypothetical protein
MNIKWLAKDVVTIDGSQYYTSDITVLNNPNFWPILLVVNCNHYHGLRGEKYICWDTATRIINAWETDLWKGEIYRDKA